VSKSELQPSASWKCTNCTENTDRRYRFLFFQVFHLQDRLLLCFAKNSLTIDPMQSHPAVFGGSQALTSHRFICRWAPNTAKPCPCNQHSKILSVAPSYPRSRLGDVILRLSESVKVGNGIAWSYLMFIQVVLTNKLHNTVVQMEYSQ